MRLINADNLLAHKVRGEIGDLSGDFVPGFCIDREPTVDAVSVVRCEDCYKRGTSNCPMCFDEYDDEYGMYTVDSTEDNGFCHCGAKVDGDDVK